MSRVIAIILHPVPAAPSGSLEAGFAAARAANAARHARGFEDAGATARIVEVRPDGPDFGLRLRRLAALDQGAGFIILGSGSLPLARGPDRRAFVAAASSGPILTNNRYSGDITAIPPSVDLSDLPGLAADNGLPRWLADRGHEVRDLRGRWRLQVDLDSPIDVLVCGLDADASDVTARARTAAARLRSVAADRQCELVVAGRTSAASLGWVETATASRTRALVEERGLRTARAGQRPPRSVLGLVLDRDGPEALGRIVSQLGDGAIIDTRVLLAHRLGPDEAGWPPAEDRFASDLLLHERIADPWLRALTHAAAEASVPVLLGGHTLVGPGLRLVLEDRRRRTRSRGPR